MIDLARWKKRFIQYPKYIYWHAVDLINRNYSLERPRVFKVKTPSYVNNDKTNSAEFYFFKDSNSESDFVQTNKQREQKVINIKNKNKTEQCYVCGSKLVALAQVVNYDNGDDYIEMSWCQECGHCQYSVMPTKEWITNWYNTEYDTLSSLDQKLETRKKTYRYYNRIKKHLPNKKLKILEIGAGYGEKILPFKEDGHDVYCTEVTTARAQYLKNSLGFNAFLGTLDDDAVKRSIIDNGPYDLIFSYHVVEHMYNPKEELSILKDVSTPETIFYLAVPEFYKEGIINNIFNLEHLHSFGRDSGIRLMNEIGFDVFEDGADYFQYYSDYCQYFIAKRLDVEKPNITTSKLEDVVVYLESSLGLATIASLNGNSFAYKYNTHPSMNIFVTDETKQKCKQLKSHLPIRYYCKGIPLFIMQ